MGLISVLTQSTGLVREMSMCKLFDWLELSNAPTMQPRCTASVCIPSLPFPSLNAAAADATVAVVVVRAHSSLQRNNYVSCLDSVIVVVVAVVAACFFLLLIHSHLFPF